MTEAQIIEVMARVFLAHKDIRGRDMDFKISGKVYNGDVYEAMTAALAALKSSGLAIVPVEREFICKGCGLRIDSNVKPVEPYF